MDDWKKQGERLLSGENGVTLRSLASTRAARKLGESPDAAARGTALRAGDADGVQKALTALLSTPEGKSLAESLRGLGHG